MKRMAAAYKPEAKCTTCSHFHVSCLEAQVRTGHASHMHVTSGLDTALNHFIGGPCCLCPNVFKLMQGCVMRQGGSKLQKWEEGLAVCFCITHTVNHKKGMAALTRLLDICARQVN